MLELESTIVTVNNLLRLNFDDGFDEFIQPPKMILSIPDYQREYKWEKAKIKTFVDNVMQRSKFLGIITTEVTDGLYLSVVDGQQRLTTTMLMLSQLYNACADEDETETQNEIQSLITCEIDGCLHFKLENESVGKYLHFMTEENGRNKIKLEINPTMDIYKQADKFSEAWGIISKEIYEIRERNQGVTLDVYKQQLLDCKMLLFAQKNADNLQQGSSEEIYIDINEKAQKLDPEDIFKGHCFAICKTIDQQGQVKVLWRSIKQQFFSMDNIFKKADMGIFLHFYLLTQEATKNTRQDIKKDLTIGGENVITHHYNTPTKAINLLRDMEQYQSNLLSFTSNLDTLNHEFPQIMTATPQIIGNNRDKIKELNTILRDVISCNQNLFKLPLFYLIDQNSRKEPAAKLTYARLEGFTYLYYIYMFLFSRIGGSRKRGDLPNELIFKLNLGQGYLVQFIREIINYSEDFDIDNKVMNNVDTRKQLYTILDYFEATSINIPTTGDDDLTLKLRLFPDTYNYEHLLINQSHTVSWRSAGYTEEHPIANTEYTFSADDFSSCDAWTGPNNYWANFIWVDSTFNREVLKNKDIINKIILLRGNINTADSPSAGSYAKKYSHIETICQHIMNTEGFTTLLTAYSNNEPRANVLSCYRTLINNYFTEENIDILRNKFKDQFMRIRLTLKQLIG